MLDPIKKFNDTEYLIWNSNDSIPIKVINIVLSQWSVVSVYLTVTNHYDIHCSNDVTMYIFSFLAVHVRHNSDTYQKWCLTTSADYPTAIGSWHNLMDSIFVAYSIMSLHFKRTHYLNFKTSVVDGGFVFQISNYLHKYGK